MKNVVLLLIALVLAVLFFWLGIIYTLLNAIREGSFRKVMVYLSKSALSIALSIDCMGNTICRDMLNGWCRKYGGYAFGNYNETISRVLGKNKQLNTLTDAGRALANLLDWLDEDHVERAAGDN